MPVAIAPGETQQAASGQHGISQGVPSDRHTTGYRVTLYLSRTPCSIRDRGQGTRLQPRDTKHDCAMETRAHDCATKTKAPHRCLFLPTIFISNLFELFFRPKNTVYLPLGIDSASMPSSPRARLRQSRRNSTSGVVTHEATAHDCATKTKAPHRCLFLSTIFISNLFELFFRPKNTVSLRHGIDSASMPRSL
jgi:hypothetical protein